MMQQHFQNKENFGTIQANQQSMSQVTKQVKIHSQVYPSQTQKIHSQVYPSQTQQSNTFQTQVPSGSHTQRPISQNNFAKKFKNIQQLNQLQSGKSTYQTIQDNAGNLNQAMIQFPQTHKVMARSDALAMALNEDESERLLQLWRAREFQDFPQWLQTARAQLTCNITDHSTQMDTKIIKNFVCNVTLALDTDHIYKQMGVGKKKKLARAQALEKLTIDLIEQKLIHRGLKDKSVLRPDQFAKVMQQIESMNTQQVQPDQEEIEQKKRNNNKIRRLSKKARDYLREDDFGQALEVLCSILQFKEAEWNEVSWIWGNAVSQKNLQQVQNLLFVLQNKRIPTTEDEKQMLFILPNSTNKAQKQKNAFDYLGIVDEQDKKTISWLEMQYGQNCRLPTSNPYELFDFYSVDMNDQQIDRTSVLVAPEDDHLKEVVRDPFEKPLQTSLSLFTEFEPHKNIPNIKPLVTPMYNFNNQSQFNQNFLDNSQYYQQNFDENTPYFQERQRQFQYFSYIKPNQFAINYQFGIPLKLVLEFYNSLLYIGDMGFALQLAELLYTKVKLETGAFLTIQSANYFAQKLNVLCIELIEQIFSPFTQSKLFCNDYLTNTNGSIECLGVKYIQQVISFRPNEVPEQLKNKLIIKQNQSQVPTEEMPQISEGEFVLVSSFFQPTYDNPFLKQSASPLANFINALAKQQRETQSFINCVTEFGNTVEFALIASVTSINREYRVKMVCSPSDQELKAFEDKQRLWKITKLANRGTTDRTIGGLVDFCTQQTMHNSMLQLILSTSQSNSAHLKSLCDTTITPRPLSDINNNLNISQKQVLQYSSSHLLTLIQSPPGTGRTVASVEIIAEWLRQNNEDFESQQKRNQLANPPNPQKVYRKQVLVCSPNDFSVTLLVNELTRAGIKVIKFTSGFDEDFNGGNPNYEQNPKLASLMQKNTLYQNPQNLKFFVLSKKLREADVIVTTPQATASPYIKASKFNKILIDDATKITEPNLLLPLSHSCNQVVLIGDHCTLGPKVVSSLAINKGLQISFFERLFRQGVRPLFLDIQYRVHPSLATFPSMAFYQNNLNHGVDAQMRPIIEGFLWPSEQQRIALISVKGFEQLQGNSLQNTKEVGVLTEILMQVLQEGFIKLNQVLILTPFTSQKKKIKWEINNQAKKFPTLFGLTQEEASRINKNSLIGDIETIDNYKGLAKDLVILSTVRCNKNGNLGIIKDSRRLNTVLNKAKRGLIVIGDIETLCYDFIWREFVKLCKWNNLILNYH